MPISDIQKNPTTGALYVEQLNTSLSSSGHPKTVIITRPANTTPYTALDVVGNATTAILEFTDIVTFAGEKFITSIELEVDVTAVPSGMAGFNVRLYNASPTAISDNDAWDFPVADRGKYLGKVQLATPVDEISTLFSDNDQINKPITMISTSLFVILQTIGAYTPGSGTVKRLTIHLLDA